MGQWNSGSVGLAIEEKNAEKLEAILSTYITDGYFNGVAIGLRNIDPMIFKHLADLGLIKTVSGVRGTGDTLCFGAYFPRALSIYALSCIEGTRKPFIKIKPEVMNQLNINRMMKWIVEYEAATYLTFWGENALMIETYICQYEDITRKVRFEDVALRKRFSCRETTKILHANGITPSRLWLEDIIKRFTAQSQLEQVLEYFKAYQMDVTANRTSLAHNYYLYVLCSPSNNLWTKIISVTLPNTWKNIVCQIYVEAVKKYLNREISKNDLYIIKHFIGCSKTKPRKGPYNEYILSKMELIEELLSSNQGSLKSRYAREQRLNQLIHYFTEVREKSTKTLNRILNAEEKRRLKELADIIKPLNELIEIVCEKGTPIEYLTNSMVACIMETPN